MDETQKLLAEIKAFCKEVGLSEKTFGAYALNNSKLVGRLTGGGTVELPQATRIRSYMAAVRGGADAGFQSRRGPKPKEATKKPARPSQRALARAVA